MRILSARIFLSLLAGKLSKFKQLLAWKSSQQKKLDTFTKKFCYNNFTWISDFENFLQKGNLFNYLFWFKKKSRLLYYTSAKTFVGKFPNWVILKIKTI